MPLSGNRIFVIMLMDETDQQRDQEQEAAGWKEKRTVPVESAAIGYDVLERPYRVLQAQKEGWEKQPEKSAFCTKIRKNGKECAP